MEGGELGAVDGGLRTEDGGGGGPVGVCGDGGDVGGQDGAEGASHDGVVGFGGKGVDFGFDRVDFRNDGGDAGVEGEGGGEEGEVEEGGSGELETHGVCVLGGGVSGCSGGGVWVADGQKT